ncbi:MAG: cupin domain-containing protein [Alphaproteobacteria bacterium]|nr:cupin domain-containing protein [Alphaproteobacteria bacterium]
MRIMMTGEQTNGALAAIMATLKLGEGPPPHFHRDRDECVYVVEGTYDVTVGEQKATVGAGTLMFIPANTVHSLKNVGKKAGKMLNWSLPGGQKDYFRTIHQLAAGGGFSAEKVHAISKEFDTEFPA